MNKKLFGLSAMIALLGANAALAAYATPMNNGQTSEAASVLAISPIYLQVEIGKQGVCNAHNEYFAPCPLTNLPEQNKEYKGSITVVGGKITVAKEILINSDETLTNSVNDTGKPSDQIDFDFHTPFYKGLILKVQPEANYPEESNYSGVSFSETDPGGQTSLNIPFVTMLHDEILGATNSITVKALHHFPEVADLDARNESFQKKLLVEEELMKVGKWARVMYLNDKITDDLYLNFNTLMSDGWQADYNDVDYFRRRYGFLKANYNNNKVTPALFYGGLSNLIKKISN